MSPDHRRRATSLVELLIALTLIFTCLVPLIAAMKGQVKDTRWVLERRIAIGLANDILDRYQAMGYQWLRQTLTGTAAPYRPPLGVVDSTYSPSWNTTNLCYDSWSGYQPYTNFPAGDPPPPNALNPVLGGPQIIEDPSYLAQYDRGADEVTGRGSLTRGALEGAYRFRRRVEIMGGSFAQPGGNTGFNPWPNPATTAPGQQPIQYGRDCFIVRVTIMTGSPVDRRGTMAMKTPGGPSNGLEDLYQVVTVIANHP